MARIQQVPINPDVLSWAIRTSGLDDRAVASRLKVDVNTVGKWLSGTDRPIISEFRSLVKVLRRSSAIFFLPRPPQSSLIEIQFRQAPGEAYRSLSPEERITVRDAEHLQLILKWLQKELRDYGPRIASRSNSCYRRRASSRCEFRDISPSCRIAPEQFKWSSNSSGARSATLA